MDAWTEDDDYAFMLETLPPSDPMFLAHDFIEEVMLGNPNMWAAVTPESRDAWGDFSGARADFAAIPGLSWIHTVVPAEGAPDVVYMPIMSTDPTIPHPAFTRRTISETERPVGWVTLIWRPEAGDTGLWLIHAAGLIIDPDDCPRTSPGIAPNYTRAP